MKTSNSSVEYQIALKTQKVLLKIDPLLLGQCLKLTSLPLQIHERQADQPQNGERLVPVDGWRVCVVPLFIADHRVMRAA